jgi:spore coat protein U-like protein
MFRKTCSAIAISLVLASISGTASAGSTNTTLTVSATVQATCMASINSVNFGTINNLSGTSNVQTNLIVNCASGTSWTATADAGMGAGASFAARYMTNATPGGGTMSYLLFASPADANAGTRWGDGTNGSGKVGPILGNGTNQNNAIIGVLNSIAFQNSAPGTYTDTVNVTVSY